MKKVQVFWTLSLLSLSLGVLCPFVYADRLVPEPKIKIGVSTALTGNAATYGMDVRNALVFANEKVARNRFEFIFEDDRCSGKEAVTVAQKFTGVLHLPIVVGQACSGALLAGAPIYERAKTLVISPSASSPDISEAGEYIFRTWLSDAGAIKKLSEFMFKRHKKIAVLSEQTDYAQAFAKGVETAARLAPVEILSDQFLSEQNDFRSNLLRMKNQGAEALFINSQTELTFLAVLKRVRELQWKVQLYGSYWPASLSFLDAAKGSADGIIFVDAPSPEDILTEEGKNYYKEFTARFGPPQSIGILVATTIEAIRALSLAIDSRQDLKKFLETQKFRGLFGEWSFDKNGDLQGIDFVIKQVVGGKAVNYQE